jgi:hypothetical protein
MTSNASLPWKSRLAEVLLIFAVFFLQGAWPVPDVNEPYYLGKAIHFWNPDWVRDDFFLESADTHAVFYVSFGWLSLWLAPAALAWTGRVLTWGLLAWSWQRLSWAVVPRRFFAVLSGALFACLLERCHMAGEWVIGGVEAKGFAYVLVFLGLEALVRDRWNHAWLLLGAASLFHVLVGGWACIAAGFAWLRLPRQRPPLRAMAPGLVGGFLLSLPSLVPSLLLNSGVDSQTVHRAYEIQVYYRLPFHLLPQEFKQQFILRFALLIAAWALLCRAIGSRPPEARLREFVAGALAIALVGALLSPLMYVDPSLAARVLRYYWFRLSDAAVPLGAALFGTLLVHRLLQSRPGFGKLGLAIAVAIPTIHFGPLAIERLSVTVPRADAKVEVLGGYASWRAICQSIAASREIPKNACFLTPIDASTFKWRTRRPEVVNRKEVPQDATSIVEWWKRLREIHGIESDTPQRYWYGSLAELDPERLRQLGAKYSAEYVLTEAPGLELPPTPARPEKIAAPKLPFTIVYQNAGYVVYRLRSGPKP